MANISIRRDDFSIQITSPSSKRFYVRVSDPEFISDIAQISDFLIDAGDIDRPKEALSALRREVPLMFEARQWHFSDLLPTGGGEAANDDPELIRRFDEIRSILNDYFSDGSRVIDNAFIEPRRGKFDGVFVFADNPASKGASFLDRILSRRG